MHRSYWPPTTIPRRSSGVDWRSARRRRHRGHRGHARAGPRLLRRLRAGSTNAELIYIVANPLCADRRSSHRPGAERTLSPRRIGAARPPSTDHLQFVLCCIKDHCHTSIFPFLSYPFCSSPSSTSNTPMTRPIPCTRRVLFSIEPWQPTGPGEMLVGLLAQQLATL